MAMEPNPGWLDGVMYVAVRHGGMRLAEVVGSAGLKHQAAAQAVKRFAQGLAEDPARQRLVAKLKRICQLFRRDPIACE